MPSRSISAVLALCVFAWISPASVSDDKVPIEESRARSATLCLLQGAEAELTAYVDLSFTVTTEGAVRDPVVTRTEVCEEVDSEKTRPELEAAAIRAVLKFKYTPRIVDGESVDVRDVTTRITFIREDEEKNAGEASEATSDSEERMR